MRAAQDEAGEYARHLEVLLGRYTVEAGGFVSAGRKVGPAPRLGFLDASPFGFGNPRFSGLEKLGFPALGSKLTYGKIERLLDTLPVCA